MRSSRKPAQPPQRVFNPLRPRADHGVFDVGDPDGVAILLRVGRAEERQDFAFQVGDRRRVVELSMVLGTRLKMSAPDTDEPLPARLRDVLAGLMRGEAEKQIARRLGLSPNTVNRHVQRLYRRFEVRSRGELMFQLLNVPSEKERARLETNLARTGRD